MSPTATEGWVIYGSRTAYVGEIVEILQRGGHRLDCLVDNMPDGPIPSRWGRVITPGALNAEVQHLAAVVPLLTPGFRARLVEEAGALGLHRFPTLVDPTAVIARSAELAEGTVVNAAAVVGAATRIARFTHINRSASIAHDNVIEEFATLGPGCVLSGGVRVERGAFLGAGAVCAPEVTVGANSIVGAGAVVIGDVPANSVVAGVPARVMRAEVAGYRDVGV